MLYATVRRHWNAAHYFYIKFVLMIFVIFSLILFLITIRIHRFDGHHDIYDDPFENRISTFQDSDGDSLRYVFNPPNNSFIRSPLKEHLSNSDSRKRDYYSHLERLVHLDLKGAPPRVDKYDELFPLFKSLGATGLLIEWEDMFPYSGNLSGISATNTYSLHDVQRILRTANTHGLEVIPLVQTFGHLEFVLKHERYAQLRELSFSPLSVSPFLYQTYEVIFDMLKQVITSHVGITRIHIGCDEVYGLGTGQSLTITGIEKMSASEMFLSHVVIIANFILNSYPGIKPIIWDDMIRGINILELEQHGIGKLVEPMVWSYSTDLGALQWPSLWEKYGKIFGTVWIASAFKGASGPSQVSTDHAMHLRNHQEWIKILDMFARDSKRKVNVRGIALTGWQRFDHFATLCELLPVSMVSLGVCLQTILTGSYNDEVMLNVTKILKCRKMIRLDVTYNPEQNCNYPGFQIQQHIQKLYFLDLPGREELKAYLNDHQMKYKVSNPWMLRGIYKKVLPVWLILSSTQSTLRRALMSYYDEYTTNEWIETYLDPMLQKYERYKLKIETIMERRVFPRRPFAAQHI